ncbi:hypothetical protein BHE74_00029092 [Ensete ventricosum]|nr:hypothetical protein BHE74_00029092 [Ensete ventricosum]
MVPTLAVYTNLQKLKIEGFLEQQSAIVLVDAESTHNFMSSKSQPSCHLFPLRKKLKRDSRTHLRQPSPLRDIKRSD